MPFFLFLILFILMVFAVRGLNRWSENNNAPELTVSAVVGEKKNSTTVEQTPVGGDPTGAQGFQLVPHTRCTVTFETENGESLSFTVSQSEYRSLQTGEQGMLTFQGSRYLGFVRSYENSRPADGGEEEA